MKPHKENSHKMNEAEQLTRKVLKWIAFGAAALTFLAFIVVMVAPTDDRPVSADNATTAQREAALARRAAAREAAKNPTHPAPAPRPEGLEVVKAVWSAEAFGTVAEWKVTIRNKSDAPLGNITYRTVYLSETGGVVDKGGVDAALTGSQRMIQRVIPPKSSRTLEVNDGFINKEAHRARFELVDWEHVTDQR